MSLTEEVLSILNESHIFRHRYCLEDADEPLFLDSMSIVAMLSRIEEKYGLDIDYRELDLSHFHTIRAIESYLSLRLGRVAL